MEVKLYHHLMNSSRYEKAIRPTLSYYLSTNITFGFLLHQVINVVRKTVPYFAEDAVDENR